MKLKKNILKMCLHTFIYPLCFCILAIISFAFINDFEIFAIFLFFAFMCIIFNIRFVISLVLFFFDCISKKICEKDIKIDAISQNNDMLSISFNKPTIIDLFDKDSLILCNIYDNYNMKLKLYGNINLFNNEIRSIIETIAYSKYKKYGKIVLILKDPGKHSFKVTYYERSKIIKNITKI